MKAQAILFPLMAMLIIIALGISGCQEDLAEQVSPQKETATLDIQDLPDDISRHFSEDRRVSIPSSSS